MERMIKKSLGDFCRDVASDSFTPGGGCVSAYSGALGASLGKMVLTLTIGKKKYAEFDESNKLLLREMSKIQEEMIACVDRDAEGCEVIMKAMALPKNTDSEKAARKAAISDASKRANEAPLMVCDRCTNLLKSFDHSIKKINQNTLSDWACGALQAYAGLEGAAMNAMINFSSIDDQNYIREMNLSIQQMLGEGRIHIGEIRNHVTGLLSPKP